MSYTIIDDNGDTVKKFNTFEEALIDLKDRDEEERELTIIGPEGEILYID